ncbi:MAG: DUF4393 domain-containing protein [Solirubrobacteraceae bacterium]|nr:DUF4393 domain-containing protein [Solirubrobacteraceae bacterium]
MTTMSDPSSNPDPEAPRPPAAPAEPGTGVASVVTAVPGLVRIVGGIGWRATRWGVDVSLRASERLLDAARHREPPAQLLEETGTRLQAYAAELLGVRDDVTTRRGEAVRPIDPETARPRTLRERGEALTRLAYDTRYEEPQHPAASRILSELAPDEALILMALRDQGPQPAVDVRVATNLYTSSRLVADTLTMIGSVAGVHYVDRVCSYLINLERLGLIRNLREPISDPSRYMILEAQPDVLDALRSARGTRTVRRSILLTPFGEEFCRLALPDWAGPGDADRPRPSDRGT